MKISRLNPSRKILAVVIAFCLMGMVQKVFSNDLLFAIDNEESAIRRLDLNINDPNQLNWEEISGLNNPTQINIDDPIAISYDPVEQMIYWTDKGRQGLLRASKDGSNPEMIVTEISEPEGLAIDIKERKIYWSDSSIDKIEIADLDGGNKRIFLDTGLDQPRDIVLDQINRHIYWTDWGEYSEKIERSDMDTGNNRISLINADLGWPTGLALDLHDKKMYWSDTKVGYERLEVSGLLGQNREVLYKLSSGQQPFSLALYSGYLYWSESSDRNYLQRIDLDTRQNEAVGSSTFGRMTGIHVHSESDFQELWALDDELSWLSGCLSNPCQNGATCINDYGHYTCYCENGWEGTNCDMALAPNQLCGNNIYMFDEDDRQGVFSYSTSDNFDKICVFLIKAHGAKAIKTTFTDLLMDPLDLVQYGSGSVAGINLIGSVSSLTNPSVWINSTASSWITFTVNSNGDKRISIDYEIDVNDCNPNPCQNNGFCIDKYRTYECQCLPSFIGTKCEINSECTVTPCQNGGSCLIYPGEPSVCYCRDGFHGSRCELITGQTCGENMDFLEYPGHLVGSVKSPFYPSYISSGSYCVYQLQAIQANSFKLIIRNFYVGAEIIIGMDETVGAETQFTLSSANTDPGDVYWLNSTEKVWITQYSSVTNQGFWIDYEIDWNDCYFRNPCAHGGVCLDKYGDYECVCVEGYEGKNCETASGSLCSNECLMKRNGFCNDGGVGSVDSLCELGSDCYDCGPRGEKGVGAALVCTNTCPLAWGGSYFGACVDEGYGSSTSFYGCAYGTDCADCSARGQIVSQLCSDTCGIFNNNGKCEDGGPASNLGLNNCDFGTDCTDCGPRGPTENKCKSNPCNNGGTCAFGEKVYECFCLPGWGGSHCESEDELACNFEMTNADSCHWSNVLDGDEFDWSLDSGGTVTSQTGPSSDHTYGNSSGNYQYIEASLPQVNGDRAFLIHEPFHASSVCFKFWYHIYGNNVGSLELVVKTTSENETIWTLSGNQGNSWQLGQIFVQYPVQYQLIFVGTVGNGDSGDIAIDDSTFYSDTSENCPSIPEHAAPPTPKTTLSTQKTTLPTQKTTLPTKTTTIQKTILPTKTTTIQKTTLLTKTTTLPTQKTTLATKTTTLPIQKTTLPTQKTTSIQITFTTEKKIPTNEKSTGLESNGIISIVGIIGGVIVAVALVVGLFFYFRRRKTRRPLINTNDGGDLPPPYQPPQLPGATCEDYMNPSYINYSKDDPGIYISPVWDNPPGNHYQGMDQPQGQEDSIYEEIAKGSKQQTDSLDNPTYITLQ